jgi:hypothetical protein
MFVLIVLFDFLKLVAIGKFICMIVLGFNNKVKEISILVKMFLD